MRKARTGVLRISGRVHRRNRVSGKHVHGVRRKGSAVLPAGLVLGKFELHGHDRLPMRAMETSADGDRPPTFNPRGSFQAGYIPVDANTCHK